MICRRVFCWKARDKQNKTKRNEQLSSREPSFHRVSQRRGGPRYYS